MEWECLHPPHAVGAGTAQELLFGALCYGGPRDKAGGGLKPDFSTGTAPWKEKSHLQDQPWGSGDEAQHKMQLLLC